ncbi:uncharacterized protein TEOVI_000043000 [Trypanosoma equiperdum]|uniref:Uncharacterized protein n=2 Tax=Trypanozoon TaxID=39700 RepID=Q57Y91_TRYB2|nr:hypothetical protein, conserved [Trypanosoma brucei brucei TREU927]AAX69392.1 hypothetical protein, conserved [Trypanosoma brucei]AAZ12345.1 hypothetical protein, conserved [Trypanosoma brucei brucei TREU927]SCU67431.1 hypothetical protein, conserved [Trypanosoma equiperdum]
MRDSGVATATTYVAPVGGHVHPSLQRYMPGQLPKRMKRLCTGETNLKVHNRMHMDSIRTEIAPILPSSEHLRQTLLPSITVQRAAGRSNVTPRAGPKEKQPSGVNESSEANNKKNEAVMGVWCRLPHEDEVVVRSLVESNNKGKHNAFSNEAFYFGSHHTGGAGQLEYAHHNMTHNNNHSVSAWKQRQHYHPDIWHTRAQQHPPPKKEANTTEEMQKHSIHGTQNDEIRGESTHSVHPKEKCGNVEKEMTKKAMDYNAAKNKKYENLSWIQKSTTFDTSKMTAPKLRFELTDYHNTMPITQTAPSTSQYIEESRRFETINGKPLTTDNDKKNIKYARRRYDTTTKH